MTQRRYRYFVLGVFLVFLLLHQSDKMVIGQVLEDLQRDFHIDDAAAGALGTGALVVAVIGYPVWGYLFDRFGRARLLAAASFIWGTTTTLSAVAPTFPTFLAARGSSGVDDSSYPGLFSLIGDYFAPQMRGKINGVLQLTGPVGFILSLVLVLMLKETWGWRSVFLLTGGLGLIVGSVILVGVRDIPRGSSEPEMEDIGEVPVFTFEWAALRSVLCRRTIFPLFLQGFFGVFPLNVIQFWFFSYLSRERRFDDQTIVLMMGGAALAMSVGTVLAGTLGDWLFNQSRRGRLLVCLLGVSLTAGLLLITLTLPLTASPLLFGTLLAATALFMLFSGPNIVATLYDIALPEVRSTTLAVQYFVENMGAAGAPLLVGILSTQIGLSTAILVVSVSTLALTALFLLIAVLVVPDDVEALRQEMRARAASVVAEDGLVVAHQV